MSSVLNIHWVVTTPSSSTCNLSEKAQIHNENGQRTNIIDDIMSGEVALMHLGELCTESLQNGVVAVPDLSASY